MYCLSFLDLWLLITPLVFCGHCIVCHSSILYCPSFLDLRLLITPLVSCSHFVFCPSSIYDLWLSFWYLVAIVLSVLPRVTTSDYPFGILWPLHCLSFLDLRLLITPLVSCDHCIVCPSSIYDFWLPLWNLVAIALSVLPRFTTSDYPFGILWPLYFLSFLDLRLLITILVSFGHCVVCSSSIYEFWLPFWYLQTFLILAWISFGKFDVSSHLFAFPYLQIAALLCGMGGLFLNGLSIAATTWFQADDRRAGLWESCVYLPNKVDTIECRTSPSSGTS